MLTLSTLCFGLLASHQAAAADGLNESSELDYPFQEHISDDDNSRAVNCVFNNNRFTITLNDFEVYKVGTKKILVGDQMLEIVLKKTVIADDRIQIIRNIKIYKFLDAELIADSKNTFTSDMDINPYRYGDPLIFEIINVVRPHISLRCTYESDQMVGW